jgi:hypothetical protein
MSKGYIKYEDRAIIVKLTGYLIFNTFHAYGNTFPDPKKQMIWNLVKVCVDTLEIPLEADGKGPIIAVSR